jgi:hypothetical protein
VLITGSRFGDNAASYGSAIEVENPSSVVIERSVFIRNLGNSVVLVSTSDPVLVMTNNYLIHNEGVAVCAMGGDADLLHNTFWGDEAGIGVEIYQEVNGVMRNNIISGFSQGILLNALNADYVISHTLFYDNADNGNEGSGPVLGDPCFVSMPAEEPGYHLTQCSAAINAGEDAGVTEDYDGDTRPRLGGFDIGADEFGWSLFLPLVLRLP